MSAQCLSTHSYPVKNNCLAICLVCFTSHFYLPPIIPSSADVSGGKRIAFCCMKGLSSRIGKTIAVSLFVGLIL